MTLRPLAALLPLFALGACAPPVAADDDDATGPVLSGDDDDQRPSPVAMSLRAGFGWDPERGESVPYYLDLESPPLSPWLDITLLDGEGRTICTINLHEDQPADSQGLWASSLPVAPWLAATFGPQSGGGPCDLDPGAWRDPGEVAVAAGWGFGAGEPDPRLFEAGSDLSLRDEIVATEGEDVWRDHIEPYLLGGLIWSSLLGDGPEGGVEQEAYAFALRLDESFALIPDEERHSGGDYMAFGRIEAEATAGPLRAAYQVTSMAPLPVDLLRL